MPEYFINSNEVPYIIMGAYGRLMDMFGEYREWYGHNKRKDTDRENQMLILYSFIMCVRHECNSDNITQQLDYQKVISNMYVQYSLQPYTNPIINGDTNAYN